MHSFGPLIGLSLGVGLAACASSAFAPDTVKIPSVASTAVPAREAPANPERWWLTPRRVFSPGLQAVQVFLLGKEILALGREHGAAFLGPGGVERKLDASVARGLNWILLDPPYAGDWVLGTREGTEPDSLVALDAKRLEPSWELALGKGHHFVSVVRGPHGALISASSPPDPGEPPAPREYVAKDEETGRVLWRRTEAEPGERTGRHVLAIGDVYWIVSGKDGKESLQILDATTGALRWSEPCHGLRRLLTNGKYVVAIVGEIVSLRLEARDAETGKLVGRKSVQVDWQDRALVDGDALFIVTSTLRAFSLPNLTPLWEVPVEQSVRNQFVHQRPFIAAEGAIVLCEGGALRAFDERTGAELWSYGLELPACRSFAVAPGPRVYAAQTDDYSGSGDDTIIEFAGSGSPPEEVTVRGTVSFPPYAQRSAGGAQVAVGNTLVTANDAGQYVAHVAARGVLRVRPTVYVQDDDEKCDSDATGVVEIPLNGAHEYRADVEIQRDCW